MIWAMRSERIPARTLSFQLQPSASCFRPGCHQPEPCRCAGGKRDEYTSLGRKWKGILAAAERAAEALPGVIQTCLFTAPSGWWFARGACICISPCRANDQSRDREGAVIVRGVGTAPLRSQFGSTAPLRGLQSELPVAVGPPAERACRFCPAGRFGLYWLSVGQGRLPKSCLR